MVIVSQRRILLTLIDNIVWVIAIGFFIFFSLMLGNIFFNLTNLHFILYLSSIIGLLVLAEGIALISGNFDLSVAQITGLTAVVNGVLIINGLPGEVAIFSIILIGAGLGAVNGFFVGKMGLNPFLVTLSTFLMFDWLTFIIRKTSILSLPDIYMLPGSGKVGGIYMAILIFFATVIILFYILRKTTFGNHIYATGGNPAASKMCGINTGNIVFWVFVIAGALSGLSGLLYTGYAGAVTSTLADGQVFMAFAGAIIGGISLAGGRGKATGAVGGVILLGIIDAGLMMMMISPEVQGYFTGLLVLAAILINRFMEKQRNRMLMPR